MFSPPINLFTIVEGHSHDLYKLMANCGIKKKQIPKMLGHSRASLPKSCSSLVQNLPPQRDNLAKREGLKLGVFWYVRHLKCFGDPPTLYL